MDVPYFSKDRVAKGSIALTPSIQKSPSAVRPNNGSCCCCREAHIGRCRDDVDADDCRGDGLDVCCGVVLACETPSADLTLDLVALGQVKLIGSGMLVLLPILADFVGELVSERVPEKEIMSCAVLRWGRLFLAVGEGVAVGLTPILVGSEVVRTFWGGACGCVALPSETS